jgi:hypothetical protein
MLTNANAKSERTETSEKLHFCDILHHSSSIWKYASFEGVEIAENPILYRQLGLKKASQKDAIFRNSRVKKRLI